MKYATMQPPKFSVATCAEKGRKLALAEGDEVVRPACESMATTMASAGMPYDNYFAIVVDGMMDLGEGRLIEGQTLGEFYVKALQKTLTMLLTNPVNVLVVAVDIAIAFAAECVEERAEKNAIKLEPHTEPAASLAVCRMVRVGGELRWQLYMLGNVTAIVETRDGEITVADNLNGNYVSGLDEIVLGRMQELAKERGVSVLETRGDPEIVEMLKANRALKNTPDGYYAASMDTAAATHGECYEIACSKVRKIILHTAGFDYAMAGLTRKQMVDRCGSQDDLRMICQRIRAAEMNDKGANKYPRFKPGNSMAVVAIESTD